MKIIKSISEVSKLVNKYKKDKKKIGLVVGGFDILHMGHVNLFRQSKKYVDILIVGLDNDKTLTITKGNNRPINNYKRRSQFLSELSLIDHIFKIDKIFKHGDKNSDDYFINLYKKIRPTHIFTHTGSDSLHEKRKDIAKSLNIKFIPDRTKFVTSTSEILNKIMKEI